MSDDYEARLAAWCEKHNVRNPAAGEEPMELFIEPGSEMDETLRQEVDGAHTILMDYLGWAEKFKTADLRALVAKHGRLATWDDFARLGELKSTDVGDGDHE